MGKEDLLLVDDDEDLCMQLAERLEDDGFSVRYTTDPFLAERLIRDLDFGIVVLDYKMPGMTGVDLLRTIKKKSLLTRVFIVSGRPFVEKILREENVAHLVEEVIAKPFDVVKLYERLKVCEK